MTQPERARRDVVDVVDDHVDVDVGHGDGGLWIAPLMRTDCQVGLNLDDFKTGWLGLVFLDEDVFVNLLVTSGMISERTRRRTRLSPRALVSFIIPYIRSSVVFK